MPDDEIRTESNAGEELARDAEALRREILHSRQQEIEVQFPTSRKILYSVSIALILGMSFLVLGSATIRRALVSVAAVRIAGESDPSAQVFPLPAPPPKAPRVNADAPFYTASAAGMDDVLYAGAPPAAATSESAEQPGRAVPKFVPPPKSPGAGQAYALLQEKSEVAADVIQGRRDDFKFKQWMPRKADPPVFWIDLVTERASDSKEVHLIWQVNTDSGEIQPLSQEARDLAH